LGPIIEVNGRRERDFDSKGKGLKKMEKEANPIPSGSISPVQFIFAFGFFEKFAPMQEEKRFGTKKVGRFDGDLEMY
jgi:hypothetical protein